MTRRHITTAVTMVVLVGVLVVGVLVGWEQLFADFPGEDSAAEEPTPTCTTKKVRAGHKIRSSQVRVSVYNGGNREGLAGNTMRALRKRGFKAGEVGNAPSSARVRKVAVWSTEQNDAAARLVALQFGRKVRVTFSDADLGPGIDVIVGNKFGKLHRARHAIRIKSPEDVCVPNAKGASPDNGVAG